MRSLASAVQTRRIEVGVVLSATVYVSINAGATLQIAPRSLFLFQMLSLLSRLASPLSRFAGWKRLPAACLTSRLQLRRRRPNSPCSFLGFWTRSSLSCPLLIFPNGAAGCGSSNCPLRPSSTSWTTQSKTTVSSSALTMHLAAPYQMALSRKCRKVPYLEVPCIALWLRACWLYFCYRFNWMTIFLGLSACHSPSAAGTHG